MIGRRHIYKVPFCELRSADVREVEATRVCAESRAARQNPDAELAALYRERNIQRARAKECNPAEWLQ